MGAFEKEHKSVLADIRNTVSKCSESFTGLNFQISEYTDSTGRKLPMYILTKDGFMMLALEYSNPSRSVQDHCKHSELFRTTNTVGLDINPRGELVVPDCQSFPTRNLVLSGSC